MKRILFALILPFACCAAIANPADKSQRESEAMSERIKQGDNDKQRWARISLYSDSEAPEDLAMPLVKDVGLWMKLDPSRGHLEFSSKGSVQVFAIAAARNARRTVCAKYNLRAIDASAKHALLRRVCNEYEYRPNHFLASVDYFIYDAETASMRAIWHNEVTNQGAPLPVAKPVPVLRSLPNGYRFDWKSERIGNNSEGPAEIHTSYLRNGAGNLTCTDNAATEGKGTEAGYCEGERPPLVTSRHVNE
ncbi:hypothetical protein ACN9MU_10020 [Pseudoduganella sp. R-32]|uniref:hypothetical protein n=1 Tax=Pseudoduganella sp. R-32 TaxID=3404061 RepID=UPI003CF11A73